ncbi:hypothetical protein BXY70_3583 [Roseovarius halotolerans]|uniref:SGNH hydrolase-type esterase domain-containing protein n=1 Tax=Roseovarius halotolerans TaxID=505353 RepID=A0A1X6ZMB2_9RHOB|nr:hypothetical protein [Roseovarius halotolerans]RKT28223.1 hypothetical protein BXY70_3583 [Roseovarius halotolerans]SLN55529.1 hypothetical protein ROH8110_03017 [Roseovarius halotolerans]
MTRVAIIGNSHIGAYMLAREAIEAAFPKVALSFFALPRHSFSSCRYDENGVLIAREPAAEGLPDRIDLSEQDHILLTGQSFAISGLSRMISDFDVLGLAPRGRARSVSLMLLTEFLDFRIERYCEKLARFLRGDPRCVVVPAPFPADGAADLPQDAAAWLEHPSAADLIGLWSDTVDYHMSGLDYGYMPQPDHLTAGPGRSIGAYARAATLAPEQTPAAPDYTHMNSDYGFAHFEAFARQWLGLEPECRPHSPRKEYDNGLGPQ